MTHNNKTENVGMKERMKAEGEGESYEEDRDRNDTTIMGDWGVMIEGEEKWK